MDSFQCFDLSPNVRIRYHYRLSIWSVPLPDGRFTCDATFNRSCLDIRSLALFLELGIMSKMASTIAAAALVLLTAFAGLVHSLASTDTITWGGDNTRAGYQT